MFSLEPQSGFMPQTAAKKKNKKNKIKLINTLLEDWLSTHGHIGAIGIGRNHGNRVNGRNHDDGISNSYRGGSCRVG